MKWAASERLCFASKQSPNFEDFNMVKIEPRPQTELNRINCDISEIMSMIE